MVNLFRNNILIIERNITLLIKIFIFVSYTIYIIFFFTKFKLIILIIHNYYVFHKFNNF